MSGSIACVILARGGSKRLPGKNRQQLGDTPLWERTVQCALRSGVFGRILFTTDDELIRQGLAERYPEVAIHDRPGHLAGGGVTSMQVITHMLREERQLFGDADAFTVLTPCHPFRTADCIRESVSLFRETGAGSVVTVTEYPCPPEFALKMEKGVVSRSWDGPVRRGDLDPSYYPNGSVSVVGIDGFLEHGNYYVPDTRAVTVPWPESLDIDEASDLELAKRLLAAGFGDV